MSSRWCRPHPIRTSRDCASAWDGIVGRGLEAFGTAWSFYDVTPLGRQESWQDAPAGSPQAAPYEWWRRHGEYDADAVGARG